MFGLKLRRERRELGRQVLHLLFGTATIAVLIYFYSIGWDEGRILAQITFTVVLCAALFVAHLKLRAISTPFDPLFAYVGKRDRFPAEGALWYILGILLILTFLQQFREIATAILILAIGDSVSTIFARRGAGRGLILKNKTPESIVAFILLSLPLAVVLVGSAAIPLVILCALFEAVDLKINDNFLIPIVCVVFFLLF